MSSARSRRKCWVVGPGTLCSGWSGWTQESPSKRSKTRTQQRAKLRNATRFLEGLKFEKVSEILSFFHSVSFRQNNVTTRLIVHWKKLLGPLQYFFLCVFSFVFRESWQVACLDAWNGGKHSQDHLLQTKTINWWQWIKLPKGKLQTLWEKVFDWFSKLLSEFNSTTRSFNY